MGLSNRGSLRVAQSSGGPAMPPIAAKWLSRRESPSPNGGARSPHITKLPPKIKQRMGTAIKEHVIPGYTGYMQNMRQGTAALQGTYEHCRKQAYLMHTGSQQMG